MYADEIKLTDAQRREIERIRRDYRERSNEVIAAARKNWIPCHQLTKAPVQGQKMDLRKAADCSRKAGDLHYQANMLWFETVAKGAEVLTRDQITWLEAHFAELDSAIPNSIPAGNGR